MSGSPDNVFFAQGDVTVTQTRFVVAGDTYSMANVSSCRTRYTEEEDAAKKLLLYAAIGASIIVGVVLAVLLAPIVGGVIGIGGIVAAFIFIKPGYKLYHLYLGTNSGELEALSSADENLILQVKRAVDDAVVARG